ncbi:MAG: alpha/beta hydrolase [Haloarculaceae archaeon]
METVRSGDGVAIAVERWGAGPPVVAVHGSDTTRRSWRGVAAHLDGFQVCAMDRRGRGASGDGDGYTMAREVADVRAVVEAVAADEGSAASRTGGVALVGHSFGALPAFETARRSDAVSRLVLYEPPALRERHRAWHLELVAEVERRVSEGDVLGAVRHFEREAAGACEATLDGVDPADHLALADQTRREIAAVGGYRAPAGSGIAVPTLCLVGEESPVYLHETTRALADGIPDSRVEMLAGEGHLATLTGPAVLAEAIDAFLRE